MTPSSLYSIGKEAVICTESRSWRTLWLRRRQEIFRGAITSVSVEWNSPLVANFVTFENESITIKENR